MSARVGIFGIGLGDLLAAVRRPARAHRGLPAARRGARRRARRRGRVGRARRHRAGRAGGRRPLRGGAGRPRALPRRHLRHRQHGAAGGAGGEGAGRAARAAAGGDARLREHRHRRVAGQLRGLLRARDRRRVHARAGSPTTPSRGRSTATSARGRGSARWVRAAGVARALRRARIGFLGHVYPGMLDMYTDFTAVHAQVGAHVEVLEIDDLGARVAQVDRRRGRGQDGGDRGDVRVRRPVRRPDRRPDRARRSSTGRRASRRAWTGSSPTSSSTR